MDLPGWVRPWCRDHLGAEPVEQLHSSHTMSEVLGLRLADGREVAVKARPSQEGREATCLEVQRTLAQQGFPCAAPLTGMTVRESRPTHGLATDGVATDGVAMDGLAPDSLATDGLAAHGLAIHAEQWRPGGEMLRGGDPGTAGLFARLLARLVDLAADIEVGGTAPGAVPPPLPNPEWTRWDHLGPDAWPPLLYPAERRSSHTVPTVLDDAAVRLRERFAASRLPRVLGHADWETQNLRWHGDQPWAVHDWDSMAWLPEAAIAGAAAGAFASAETPTLTSIAASAAFLDAYQAARRPFTPEETEIAWAASLWLALHNALSEVLWDRSPVALTAVAEQAEERLRLAGA